MTKKQIKEIKNCKKDFILQIADIEQLLSFNDNFSIVTDEIFEKLIKKAKIEQCNKLIPTIENLKGYVSDLSKYPELNIPVNILYTQTIVLIVTALETYFRDLFKILVKINPTKVIDKHKTLKVSTKLLSTYKFNISKCIDQIVLESNGSTMSFQDLQSIIRSFDEYTNLDLAKILEENKDSIIYCQALRHVIVHNLRKVDQKFMKQVRNTCFDNSKVSEGDYIQVDKKLAKSLLTSISSSVTIIDKEAQKL